MTNLSTRVGFLYSPSGRVASYRAERGKCALVWNRESHSFSASPSPRRRLDSPGGRVKCWLVLLFCFAASLARAQDVAPLVRLTQPIKNAQLVAISQDGAEFLDSTLLNETFKSEDLVRWGSLPANEQTDQVLLNDGSILVGSVMQISRAQVVVETDVWGELALDRALVCGVIWKLPTEQLKRTKFRDALTAAANESREEKMSLRNGDFLNGRLLEGNSSSLKFQTEVGEIDLRTDLAAAWRSRVRFETFPTSRVVGLRDGTRLVASKLRAKQRIEADLQCGLHVGSLLEIRPIDERLITYVRFDNPSVKYLSEIKPLGHKHIPFLSTSWSWGRDRNVLGGQISSASHAFGKGIGMHSTSRLAFDLPEGFDEFQAEASIDQSAGKGGSVVFRVFTSQNGSEWEPTFKSDIVRGGDLPRPIRVRLRDVKRLALVVDFAERGDQLDRANWIGARLVRLPSE